MPDSREGKDNVKRQTTMNEAVKWFWFFVRYRKIEGVAAAVAVEIGLIRHFKRIQP
jgi:hypothetical protein